MTYHNIITRAELMELPIEEQRALMQEWRKRYSVEKICRDTGIPYGGSFYNYLRYLGLPTNANTRGNKRDMGVATMNLYDKKKIEKQESLRHQALIHTMMHISYQEKNLKIAAIQVYKVRKKLYNDYVRATREYIEKNYIPNLEKNFKNQSTFQVRFI